MNYRIPFSLILVLIKSSLFAQITVQGTITTKKNEKVVSVPFANIALYEKADSTQIVEGAVTDFDGNFLFDNIGIGRYRLEISCIGYKTLVKDFRIVMPSVGNVLKRNFQMEEDAQMLSEVVIEGSRTTQYVDKTVRTFTQKEIKSARYSKDLMETLPQLTTDAQSGKLKDIRGGSMQVLINGVCATDNELKLLPPDKVLRVEYYDIPPARYAKSGSVVNIITKTLDDGYSGGIDLSHSFTTGFANDNAYFKYNKGNNQFTMEYRINYRDYDEREQKQQYRYNLNNETRESNYSRKDAFGYTTHTVGLKFTNQVMDKYIFQIAVKPNFQTVFSKGTKKGFNQLGHIQKNLTGSFSDNRKIFSPVVDIYFWKRLNAASDISFNVVGTMFYTKVDKENKEYELPTMNQILSDIMQLENRKQSLIGEVAYTQKTTLGNLNAGLKMDMNWLKSDISNVLGDYNYTSRYNEQYLYTEISGKKNKWLYRISLGGMFINSKSYSNEYNKFIFTPKFMFGYSFNNKNSLRLLGERTTRPPSVSDLSNNAQLLTLDIVSKGNPILKNATESRVALMYSFNNKYSNLKIVGLYAHTDNAINEFFSSKTEDSYITLTKENAINSKFYGGYVVGSIKPFGTNFLTIKGSTQFLRQTINSDLVGKLTNWYSPVYVQGVFKHKKLTVSYTHRFISQKLSGAYLEKDENISLLKADYRYKNLSFSAGVYWIGQPSKYHLKSLDGSLVNYTSNTKIWDNKNMFVFGFSWNFHKGKSYKINRNLHNKDTDAGTF